MKRKHYLKWGLLLLLWLLHLSVYADGVKSLTFLVGGKPVMFNLADNPVITYSNNNLVIITTKNTVILDVSEIENVSFSEQDVTGIGIVPANNVVMSDGSISFFHLTPGSLIRVYSVNGELQYEERVTADGNASMEIKTLPTGVYIIRTESQSIKFINK